MAIVLTFLKLIWYGRTLVDTLNRVINHVGIHVLLTNIEIVLCTNYSNLTKKKIPRSIIAYSFYVKNQIHDTFRIGLTLYQYQLICNAFDFYRVAYSISISMPWSDELLQRLIFNSITMDWHFKIVVIWQIENRLEWNLKRLGT